MDEVEASLTKEVQLKKKRRWAETRDFGIENHHVTGHSIRLGLELSGQASRRIDLTV